MRRTLVAATAAFYLWTIPAPAQQTIDFTGHWTLNREKSKLQLKQLSGLEQAGLHIEHREPEFTLHRVFTVDGKENSISFHLTTDGKEIESRQGDRLLFMRMHWEGNSLLFVTRILSPGGEAINSVRYRLLEGGRVFQAEEEFRGPRLRYDNLWVFDRQ